MTRLAVAEASGVLKHALRWRKTACYGAAHAAAGHISQTDNDGWL
jgi:hypothetical protein